MLPSLALGALLSTAPALTAQEDAYIDWHAPLKPDTTILTGTLPNGLSYFLKQNPNPEGKASFYFAQRVGSIQEEDDQRGLAHFLEHMAFNGTKHFPGHDLVAFLERHGIGFGEGINAFTSVDHTIYHIDDIDITDKAVTDSVLFILRDWSDGITLSDAEIDKERGVIEAEWRGGENAQSRLFKETVLRAFPEGHPYGTRLPIGEIEVIRSFPYKVLRDYYHTWYRPDLQAVVAVGDFDPKAMEREIKRIFSDIPLDPNRKERVYYDVPEHVQNPHSFVVTDPEAQGSVITVHWTGDRETPEYAATPASLRDGYLTNMAITLMNGRFNDKAYSATGAPYLGAYLNYGDFLTALTQKSFSLTVITPEGKALEALTAALTDLQTAVRYGFFEGEYKKVYRSFSRFGRGGDEGSLRPSSSWAGILSDRFALREGPLPDQKAESRIMHRIEEETIVADIDSMLRSLTGSDRSLTLYLQAAEPKEGQTLPTGEELLEAYQKAVLADSVPRFDYEEVPEHLMKEPPAGGTLAKVEKDQIYGSTKVTLGNGVTVYLLKNPKDPGSLTLSGLSPGGLSVYDEKEDGLEIKAFSGVATMGGVADYTPMEVYKIRMNSSASADVQVTTFAEAVSGSSSVADFEDLMQIVYLKMTQNRKDTTAFNDLVRGGRSEAASLEPDPMTTIMNDTLPRMLYPASVLDQTLGITPADLPKVDYDRVLEMFEDRFSDASDFTFFIVGGFKEDEELIPLITTYLGALPSTGRKEETDYSKVIPYAATGAVKHLTFPSVTPISQVYDMWVAPMPYDLKADLEMQILTSILDGLFVQTIREDEGGTYGIGVYGQASRQPSESSLYVSYQADPAQVFALNDRVKKELKAIAEGGVDGALFQNAVNGLEENHTNFQIQSAYWLNQLINAVVWKSDDHSKYLDILHSISKDDIARLMRTLLSGEGSRYFELVASGTPEE